MNSGKKPLYIVVAAVGIALASGVAWWWQRKPAGPPAEPTAAGRPAPGPAGGPPAAGGAGGPGGGRPPMVEVARVEVARLVDDAQAVGTLKSRQSVMLRPEVSGRVARIGFRDGERVKKGQLLIQLDDDLPRAQVAQAQAELSIAQANHRRNQDLVAQNFISQRSVDESGANLQVAQAKLALAQAQAQRLRVVAPFDGVAGLRSVNLGDYLKDGADIVNIEDLDAILVDFRLPERFQAKIRRGQTAQVRIDALPGQKWAAQVQAIDPLVDANGRSVGVRGCIDNRRGQLRPGMFARVDAVFGVREGARVVPEEAIVPQGGRVFVVKLTDGPDEQTKIAQRVEVKLGLRQPGKVEVTEGLAAGDLVVTAGHQRIQQPGTPVRVMDMSRAAGGAGGPPSAPRDNGAPSVASAANAGASAPAPDRATAAPAPAASAAGTPPARAAAAARDATPTTPGNPCDRAVNAA